MRSSPSRHVNMTVSTSFPNHNSKSSTQQMREYSGPKKDNQKMRGSFSYSRAEDFAMRLVEGVDLNLDHSTPQHFSTINLKFPQL